MCFTHSQKIKISSPGDFFNILRSFWNAEYFLTKASIEYYHTYISFTPVQFQSHFTWGVNKHIFLSHRQILKNTMCPTPVIILVLNLHSFVLRFALMQSLSIRVQDTSKFSFRINSSGILQPLIANKWTYFINTYIYIYIYILFHLTWLLHISAGRHNQGAYNQIA